ncbi:hypothetical protein EG329_006729 [Mollisiaceae sp. DMI_Dod_QoI]|nr:hypothetical protein EG329_006729 [Helotiales sp. DMI_Dod_QoI]
MDVHALSIQSYPSKVYHKNNPPHVYLETLDLPKRITSHCQDKIALRTTMHHTSAKLRAILRPQSKDTEERAFTFEFFAKLPLELRVMIWRYAIYLFPRIIVVRPSRCFYRPLRIGPYRLRRDSRAHASSIPTLLCVNREARYELLAYFFNPFAPEFCTGRLPPIENLLINFHTDHLLVTACAKNVHLPVYQGYRIIRYLFLLQPETLDEIRRYDKRVVGLHMDYFWPRWMPLLHGCNHGKQVAWLKDFGKLEELLQKIRAWRLVNGPGKWMGPEDLFGPDWHSYLAKSGGYKKGELPCDWLFKVFEDYLMARWSEDPVD